MEKYTWDFAEDGDGWGYDTDTTIEGCIVAAQRAVRDGGYYTDNPPVVVYIGENVPFIPTVDAENILEWIREDAIEICGDIAADWSPCDYKKKKEIAELSDAISEISRRWMEKYGYNPQFYAVQNIKAHNLQSTRKMGGGMKC